MKILLIHQYFLEDNEHGGSRWNEMTRIWAEAGHDITVVAGMVHANGSEKRPEYKGKYFARKKQGKVNVIRTHVSESYNKNFIGRLWGYFSFMFSAMWAGVFQTGKGFDCVVVTSPPLFVGLSGYVISRLKRIPLVFEIRDLWPESAIDTGVLTNKAIIKLAYAFENFIYRKARLINVLTPAFREVLLTQKKVPAEKIIFIPNAADFSLSEQLMREFDAKGFREQQGWSDDFVVTYVGAHGVANGLEQVVDTAALLRDTPVRFVLIGAGMQKEKVKSYASEKGCNNVQFLDPVPKKDVFKYILASDMGASVLIKNDTFKTVYSNKTFDYMACKKPILMAIDGVSRKLVEEANAGCFVEPENPQDFSAKVRYYLQHTDRLQQQGQSGYEYATRNFDRNHLAKEYMAALAKMKSGKKY